ncbi:MAG: hypothetical protein Q9226_008388, partial [Calogaya cf. arnoldii]
MAFTTSEATLLASCKLYFGKAHKELSDKGVKSLSELQTFKDLLLRVSTVAPMSLEKMVVEIRKNIEAEKEKRAKERKKRALDAKAATAHDPRPAKRHKSTVATSDTTIVAETNRDQSTRSVEGSSNPSTRTVASTEGTNSIQEATSGAGVGGLHGSSHSIPRGTEASTTETSEVARPSTPPPPSTDTRTAASRPPESVSEQQQSQHSLSASLSRDNIPALPRPPRIRSIPRLDNTVSNPAQALLPSICSTPEPDNTVWSSATNTSASLSSSLEPSEVLTSRSTASQTTPENNSTADFVRHDPSSTLFLTPPQPRNTLLPENTLQGNTSDTPQSSINQSRTPNNLDTSQNINDSSTVNNQSVVPASVNLEMAVFAADDDMKQTLRNRLKGEVYTNFKKK